VIAARIEALVIARAQKPQRAAELVAALVRYTPVTLTDGAWRERIEATIEDLRAREILDAKLQADRDELVQRIGKHTAKTWQQLAGKTLPALGLGIAGDDGKTLAKLGDSTHPWAAAITARALGLWTEGPPPTLGAACDAYAWRELALPGKPKRCPPEIRAVFLQRALASDAGPPERQVRLYAAAAVGAPRGEPGLLRDALVRMWCAGKQVQRAAPPGARRAVPDSSAERGDNPRPFVVEVRDVASATREGVFGDRKVFIASVWNELRRHPTWSSLTLDEFKTRLLAAHRAGDLALARADLVAAMDPELVAASETRTEGASFHFIVRETP
jgi:hypothetical protein